MYLCVCGWGGLIPLPPSAASLCMISLAILAQLCTGLLGNAPAQAVLVFAKPRVCASLHRRHYTSPLPASEILALRLD